MTVRRTAIPAAITFLSGLCGFYGLLVAIDPSDVWSPDIGLAGQMIMLAMILDGLDGNVARALGATSPFGAQLDTFMDFLSFGISPGIVFLVVVGNDILPMLAVVIFVGSCAFRLARFRIHTDKGSTDNFCGLPITIAASFVAFIALLHSWHPEVAEWPRSQLIWSEILILFSALQVTTFPYPKPTQRWALYAALSVIIVVALFADGIVRALAVALALLGGIIYCSLPLFGKLEAAPRELGQAASVMRLAEPFLAPVSLTYFVKQSLKSVMLFIVFSAVYYAADGYNIARSISYSLYFNWELTSYPFWAWSSLVYESPVLMIAVLPLTIRNERKFDAYILRYIISIVICGILFVLIPTMQEYPAIPNAKYFGAAKIAFWADQANGYYNCFPSLHVINVILQAQWGGRDKSVTVRMALWIWAGLVSLSTLTMHSHYLVDIVGAVALVFLVDRALAWRSARDRALASAASKPSGAAV